MKIDIEAIRSLAKLLDETNLSEIEITEGDNSVRVNRGGSASMVNYAPVSAAAPVVSSAGAPAVATGNDAAANPNSLKSPMVGTVYLQPEPGKPSFVSVGDSVKEGDTLLIIEAMKVMNPIKATKAGVVKSIFVSDAQPVEFDEPLMIIE